MNKQNSTEAKTFHGDSFNATVLQYQLTRELNKDFC